MMRSSFKLCRSFSAKQAPKKAELPYRNRCNELQKHLQVPLFGENEAPFVPSVAEMKAAENLFVSGPKHSLSFITSAVCPEQYPQHDVPEAAIMGISNVGKSSLLKAMFSQAPEVNVKVSKTPGHTKTLNFFAVGKKLCLVDMPGYGFRQPKDFALFSSQFLSGRKNLKRTFLVMDAEQGFQDYDQDAIEMLETLKSPYALVFTKIDKARNSTILKNLMFVRELRDQYMSTLCFPQPFLVSSVTHEGIAFLQAFIVHMAGLLDVEDALYTRPSLRSRAQHIGISSCGKHASA
ncbi:GTP-binding protein 8-like isoform X2 [Dermacentor albipictus]|uniref:GTP-binding protein 8-like isoform X2 n=1 Tax=Dermacentor albipictus TaxID=60249 RepID=UPI0038FC5A70